MTFDGPLHCLVVLYGLELSLAVQRWAEHFEAALNHPPGSPDQSVDNESISAVAYTGVHTDKPTLDEVIWVVKKLKNGRAIWS